MASVGAGSASGRTGKSNQMSGRSGSKVKMVEGPAVGGTSKTKNGTMPKLSR